MKNLLNTGLYYNCSKMFNIEQYVLGQALGPKKLVATFQWYLSFKLVNNELNSSRNDRNNSKD